MASWISVERARWMETYSTKERRLVTVASGSPLDVIPIGKFIVPLLLRSFDSLAYVNMGPKQVNVSLTGNASTSDGVPIEGKVDVQVIISDDESSIKRMVIDPVEEERLLSASILTSVQETLASCTWYQVMSFGDGLSKTAEQKLSEALRITTSCFAVKSVTVQDIRPKNKTLAESLEKAAQAKEDEKLQRDLASLRAERVVFERRAKEDELQSELRLQQLQYQHELDREREQLKLEHEKVKAKNSAMKELSELLKTEEGRIAALPNEMFGYLIKELEVRVTDEQERKRLYRELLRTGQSFQAGQFSAMKAFIEQQFGVHLSEEAPMLVGGEQSKATTSQKGDGLNDDNSTSELSGEKNV